MQLAKSLEQALVRQVEVQIIAKTGWSTDELSAAIDHAEAAHEIHPPYELVSLAIGVNNQYRDRSVENYAVEFTALLQRAIGYTAETQASRVLVLSIPDWGQTPFAASDARGPEKIAAQIDLFNAESARLAAAVGAQFIDVTRLSRCGDPELVTHDGLHPSAKAYAQWAQTVFTLAKNALL